MHKSVSMIETPHSSSVEEKEAEEAQQACSELLYMVF